MVPNQEYTLRLASKRFEALDVFRGLTVAAMILVNTPGSWEYVYAPLRHAAWHGCTPADLIFPFFLFAVGMSMWFSFRRYPGRPQPDLMRRIVFRTAALFGIGLLLNAWPFNQPLADLRILGVLQRIALAYGIAAVLVLTLNSRQVPAAGAAILLGYWGLLVLGGGEAPYALESNLVVRLDRALLGERHLWRELGTAFDPEGLLSTLPAITHVLFGYLAGRYVGSEPLETRRLQGVFRMGLGSLAGGWIWSLALPLNKSLWTSSYVLFTTGAALILLALVMVLERRRVWRRVRTPFIAAGRNPLVLYCASVWWEKTLWALPVTDASGARREGYEWVYETWFRPWSGDYSGSLLFALVHVAVFCTLGWMLYRRRILIRL